MKNDEIRREYSEHRDEYKKIFDEISKAKHEKCIRRFPDGKRRFDHLLMARMIERGEW